MLYTLFGNRGLDSLVGTPTGWTRGPLILFVFAGSEHRTVFPFLLNNLVSVKENQKLESDE